MEILFVPYDTYVQAKCNVTINFTLRISSGDINGEEKEEDVEHLLSRCDYFFY